MMILVTGGASSGKSAYAEQLACSLPGSRYYLAAMKPFGEEGARRIARHRALRAGKGFVTVECYEGLETVTASSLAEAEARAEGAPEAGLPCADPLGLTARRSGAAAAELARFAGSDSPRSRRPLRAEQPAKSRGARAAGRPVGGDESTMSSPPGAKLIERYSMPSRVRQASSAHFTRAGMRLMLSSS